MQKVLASHSQKYDEKPCDCRFDKMVYNTKRNDHITSSTFQLFVELVPHITIVNIIIFSTRSKRDKKILACPASSIKYSVCVLRVVHKYKNGISRCLFVTIFWSPVN